MRKKLLGVLLAVLSAACTTKEEVVVVVTATSPSATETSPPPSPTTIPPTALPTRAPRPTSTPQPKWEPVAIGDLEQALRDAGYRRYPFTTSEGVSGFDWIKESAYESVTPWGDGSVECQVLHDTSPEIRLEHMEQ